MAKKTGTKSIKPRSPKSRSKKSVPKPRKRDKFGRFVASPKPRKSLKNKRVKKSALLINKQANPFARFFSPTATWQRGRYVETAPTIKREKHWDGRKNDKFRPYRNRLTFDQALALYEFEDFDALPDWVTYLEGSPT